MIRRFLVLLVTLLAVGTAVAATVPVPPAVDAAAYIVVGDLDNRVLAAREPDIGRPIASITKLMTVLVALDHVGLDEMVTVPPAAAGIGESSVQLRVGERISVRDLAIAALVPSANDAATALALAVGKGSLHRFVGLMNAQAAALGMTGTAFANPHGLDQDGHFSTARDVVTLLRAALRVPFIRQYAATREATIAGGRKLESTDDLLTRVAGIVGAKTGHTNGAGWSQVAMIRRDGVEVAVALLGAPDEETRNTGLQRLLEWGLTRYVRVRTIVAGRVYASAAVGWGKAPVGLRVARTHMQPVSLDEPLEERIVAPTALRLPVAAGQPVGEVRVFQGRRLLARAPLVADHAVRRPGFFGRIGWFAGRAAHHVVGIVT
jgi:D-alanyl-D-alanine carboxypeptidase